MIDRLRGERAALALLLLAGLVVRILVLGAPGYPSDPVEVTRWAKGVHDYGLVDFYAHITGGYYPAVLYLLWPLAAIFSGDALYMAVKGIAIPFDLATGLALFLLARHYATERTGVIAAGLYVLNPASIVGGALWGQLDVIGALCMLGAVVALGERRWLLAGMAAVVGGMVKAPFGIVALVVGAVVLLEAFRKRRDWRPPVRAIAGGLAGYAVVGLVLRLSPFAYLDLVREGALRFAYTSLDAFNLWAVVAGFFEPDEPYVRIGVGLLLCGLAAALAPLWWRRDTAALLAVGGAVALAFYFLPTRVHERYFFPAIVLFAPLAAARPRLRLPFALMSLAFAATLGYALWDGPYGHKLLPIGLDGLLFSRLGVYAIGLTLAGASAWLLWLLARGECTYVPDRTPTRALVGRRSAALLRRPIGWLRAVPPLVLLVVAFHAITLWPELTPAVDLNDGNYHLRLIARAADAIGRGEHPFDNWLPDLELGFPVFFYYQQLPHLAVVALGAITFGLIDLRTVFDVVRYLLLVALPLTAFASLRWMGLSRTAAGVAAIAATLFSADHRFGLEYDSYLWRGYGLYTQLWAVHLSFIALAALYRLLQRRGTLLPAVLSTAALVLVHLLYAYMLAISALVVALVGIGREDGRRRLVALALVGLLASAIAAYLVPPYLGAQAYLDVSPYLPRFRWDSFGAPTILGWLVSGDLFDHGRPPVLTALTAIGIGVAVVRRDRLGLTALALFGTWLVLYFGRATYGPLADLLPLSNGLPVHRFIGSLQIAAALLVGIAAEWLGALLAMRLAGRRATVVAAALALVLLAPVLNERWAYASVDRAWIDETVSRVNADTDAKIIIETLALLPPGRVYAGLKSNWGQSLDFGTSFRGARLFDLLTAHGFDAVRPPSFSFSLNSDLIFDFDDARLADYQVFDARYVVASPAVRLPAELRLIARTDRYLLYEAPTTGYAAYVALASREHPASQVELLARQRAWLASLDPAAGRYLRIDFPAVLDIESPTGGCSRANYEGERVLPARIEVTVACPEAASLAFKVSFHPNWRVNVDGTPQPAFMVSPSYLGVALPPGRHVVVAEYQAAPSRTPLLLAGLVVLGAVVAFRRWLDRLIG
ncbi:MAG TPA: hypothetical protein VHG53_01515 [Candidatus Limnocylindria bacterium]|nr:hypothetical protein [Candidatus Limnocylindria bacterium]